MERPFSSNDVLPHQMFPNFIDAEYASMMPDRAFSTVSSTDLSPDYYHHPETTFSNRRAFNDTRDYQKTASLHEGRILSIPRSSWHPQYDQPHYDERSQTPNFSTPTYQSTPTPPSPLQHPLHTVSAPSLEPSSTAIDFDSTYPTIEVDPWITPTPATFTENLQHPSNHILHSGSGSTFPTQQLSPNNTANRSLLPSNDAFEPEPIITVRTLNDDLLTLPRPLEQSIKPEDELYPFLDFPLHTPYSPPEKSLPLPPSSVPLPPSPQDNIEVQNGRDPLQEENVLLSHPSHSDLVSYASDPINVNHKIQNDINCSQRFPVMDKHEEDLESLSAQWKSCHLPTPSNSVQIPNNVADASAGPISGITAQATLTKTIANKKEPQSSKDAMKPINALGSACFAGFYLVTLTRTLIRNHTLPVAVRRTFLAPQIYFGFTIRDPRDGKYRHVHTVQIPYDSLNVAGEWLRARLGISSKECTFKQIKDTLQRCLTNAWGSNDWMPLVSRFQVDFGDGLNSGVEVALRSEAVVGRGFGTPRQFIHLLNCHKGAPDIRRDVDGAISARESLKWVLLQLGLDISGGDVPVAQFRDDIFPLWKQHCSYVREHSEANCCPFYNGGYFKKIMIHRHLYDVDGCLSAYHVKDLFEGLEEVIKVWTNPTGMCVREAKCAAGLRYNVDKSFQSGIRSYAKAKFLEAAPHTAQELTSLERRLYQQVQAIVWAKTKKYAKCRRALREIEIRARVCEDRPVPEALVSGDTATISSGPNSPGARKRKRQEREQENEQEADCVVFDSELSYGGMDPPTPREQKRKHAHLSLKRKEAMELQVRQYLEAVRENCKQQQNLLDEAKGHGETCACQEVTLNDVALANRYLTSNSTPVA